MAQGSKLTAHDSAPAKPVLSTRDLLPDRQVCPDLAALDELVRLLIACRRNNGRRTCHVFGVDFVAGDSPAIPEMMRIAREFGFVTSVDQASPHSLAVSA